MQPSDRGGGGGSDRGSFRRYTDEQLASAEFRFRDPLAVENLCRDRPNPELEPEILGDYDLTPPGGKAANPEAPWIWCSHCQGARHWRGFVITNATGLRYLIGSRCGPLHYGATFTGAQNAFTDRSRRADLVRRLGRIAAAAEAVCAAADQILHSPELRRLDEKREELRRASPNAFVRLASSVQSGMPLQEVVKVRNFEAEAERDDREGLKQPGPPLYRDERQSLGHLDGSALLRTRGDCRDRLVALKAAIAAAVRLRNQGTDEVATNVLRKAVTSAEDALQAGLGAIGEAENAHAFFSARNMMRLERWAGVHRDFSMIAEGGGLRIRTQHEGTRLVSALEPMRLPDLPGFADDAGSAR